MSYSPAYSVYSEMLLRHIITLNQLQTGLQNDIFGLCNFIYVPENISLSPFLDLSTS